jgi:hypothetical protein
MSINPGDIEIRNCNLGGSGGGVDIVSKIHSFSIFENIKKQYTSIEMSIIDNTDLLHNGMVDINSSSIQLSFGQPGQRPYVGDWAIMSAEKSRNLGNQRTAMYKLVGYSWHMTRHPKVQRSYVNQTATNIVSDLIGSYLSPQKGLLLGAPSVGLLGNENKPYNINGIQIHKAIRSTLLKAVSGADPSSAYVFFENQFNMVVDTLQNMVQTQSGNGPTFYQRPMGKDFLRDVAIQPFIMLNFKEEARMNRPSTIQGENQATNVVDHFSNFFKKGATGGASTYNNMHVDGLAPPNLLSQVMAARRRVAGNFDSQSITVHVALNTDVTVGRGFTVEVQAPRGDLNDDAVKLASVSGPLLATEVRHTVMLDQRQKMTGTTTAKGVKGEGAVE